MLIVGSAIAHAVVAASLAVVAMWHVDLVSVGADGGDVKIQAARLPAAQTPPSGGRLQVQHPKQVKVKIKELVQPPTTPSPPAPTPGPDSSATAAAGTGTGEPATCSVDGVPAGLPACTCSTDGFPAGLPPCGKVACEGPDCGGPPIDAGVDAAPIVEKEVLVPPNLAKGLRYQGDDQILPSRATQLEMVRAGKETIHGTFKLCVDREGTVTSVRTLASTGYDAYDQSLVDGMYGWRYHPYLLKRTADDPGVPAPICTVVMFVYRIQN
ncbi:MAG TPA: energy transducer TonB [Kofleriaceae bacterium]|nr:energy transducer TonB [Kofleriaceae bacterium]